MNGVARLKQDIRARIDLENDVRVSATSLLEISQAPSLGRLPLLPTPERWLDIAQAVTQVHVEPLTGPVCLASTTLPGDFHRDPADRLIVALARSLDAELVTSDGKIFRYSHVRTIRAD